MGWGGGGSSGRDPHLQGGALGLELHGAALEVALGAGDEGVQVGGVHALARRVAALACPNPTPTRIIAAATRPAWGSGRGTE